jgi:hypothetical protein
VSHALKQQVGEKEKSARESINEMYTFITEKVSVFLQRMCLNKKVTNYEIANKLRKFYF